MSTAITQVVSGSVERARLTHRVDLLVVDETSSAQTTAPALDLARVLDNLLANACHAAGAGGTVAITITEHDAAIAIAIVDSGPGIDDARREGGLGLTIVAALVERMGSEFVVASGEQHGTTARVLLPRHQLTPRLSDLGSPPP